MLESDCNIRKYNRLNTDFFSYNCTEGCITDDEDNVLESDCNIR